MKLLPEIFMQSDYFLKFGDDFSTFCLSSDNEWPFFLIFQVQVHVQSGKYSWYKVLFKSYSKHEYTLISIQFNSLILLKYLKILVFFHIPKWINLYSLFYYKKWYGSNKTTWHVGLLIVYVGWLLVSQVVCKPEIIIYVLCILVYLLVS